MHKCCNKLMEYYILLTTKYQFIAIVTELQHTTDKVPSTHRIADDTFSSSWLQATKLEFLEWSKGKKKQRLLRLCNN